MSDIRVGLAKLGNIGTSSMLDLMLDERAEREDVDFRVVSSGPKMGDEDGEDIVDKLLDFNPDLIIISSPNPATPGPTAAREAVKDIDIPRIVIGDAPGTKIQEDLENIGYGYIFVLADAMIGARREFLDPIEMAIFNADLIKVLSVTGAFRVVQEEIDNTISSLKSGSSSYVPEKIVDRNTAVAAADFENPYARAKAMAAYEMASKVADLDVEGCFRVHEEKEYVPIVASAHEMMNTAASLAEEARKLEKGEDSVLRTPHADNGDMLKKRKLMKSPE
ncbi:methylenetetrahydromethanopterin dehydrogenase [candidate division MSBL1 archaeon SCGC-AAA382A20]|uniref:F420-dependent methylenetetrahydromethanopterin dehydrogenase n=1 Tax=candidate division MSBL1 archaeon SCGC-AAA382A20 TaxID=1698280 RepID=A0A133VI91_9EURY|nr:methylenetetrahydromethanopterin dehydrogenase [candidate division MSBL1 archaeon SCGC-AAA382A20]